MLSSCLIPQSIDAIGADAGGAHPPPRIEVETMPPFLLPPVLSFYRQGPADAVGPRPCSCQLQFSSQTAPIVVQEDDPFITLQARWFVDYDTSVPSSLVDRSNHGGEMPGDTDFVNPHFERNVPEFDFDALGQSVTSNGIHIVELVIADEQGFDNGNATRPFRSVKAGYASTEYRFVVDVNLTPDPNKANCPGGGQPSARICTP